MPKGKYLNKTTFISMEPIENIPPENQIVLDSYVFDINELINYASHSPNKILTNPYPGAGKFSPTAIKELRSHSKLDDIFLKYDKEKSWHKSLIRPETIQAVASMLMDINKYGIDGEIDPRVAFVLFSENLPEDEQNALDNYVIEIESTSMIKSRASTNEAAFAFGQNKDSKQISKMIFSHAIIGGDAANPCVKTLQIFLWKFVLDFDPKAISTVPVSVKNMALRNGYHLGADTSGNNSSYSRMFQLIGASPTTSKTQSFDDIKEEKEENADLNIIEEDEEANDLNP